MTPTQRTIRELKARGISCGIVERWLAHAKRPGGGGPPGVRQDLFGIIDIIALDPSRGVVGVQCCGQDFASHVDKIVGQKAQETLEWLSTPGTALEIWGWRKVKAKRGGAAEVWRPRVREIRIDDVVDGMDFLD